MYEREFDALEKAIDNMKQKVARFPMGNPRRAAICFVILCALEESDVFEALGILEQAKHMLLEERKTEREDVKGLSYVS